MLEHIVTQTDGVPLFIGTDQGGAGNVHGFAAAALPLAVPGTLHASLMARLDRLPTARQVAQINAVIGRNFLMRCLLPRRAPQNSLRAGWMS